jgi:hypothetical protein
MPPLHINDIIIFVYFQHINDMTGAIHLEDTLKKAESIFLQLKQSKKLPNHLKEVLGFEVLTSIQTYVSIVTSYYRARLSITIIQYS